MPHQKTPATETLKRFLFHQILTGFHTKFRSIPQPGQREGARTHHIAPLSDCREELVWDAREVFQDKVITWHPIVGSVWRKNAKLTRSLDISHPSLKQPGITYLQVASDIGEGGSACHRECCTGQFLEVMDAVAGPVAVLLNDDRYVGDWWRTSHEEATTDGGGLRWYGTDNFFLRHPVLVSLIVGMFRQGVLLFQQGFGDAILKAVSRKDVADCLTNGDPNLALRLLTKLRPWIETSDPKLTASFPFPKGHWDRLTQLHRAIHKYGYEDLFKADLQKSWDIDPKGVNGVAGLAQGRYNVPNGPAAYWGGLGNQGVTDAGSRLAKLGA